MLKFTHAKGFTPINEHADFSNYENCFPEGKIRYIFVSYVRTDFDYNNVLYPIRKSLDSQVLGTLCFSHFHQESEFAEPTIYIICVTYIYS